VRQKLSIVHVARSPVGGIFRHISDLASAQAAAGHAVGLICDSTSGGALEDERIAALGPSLALGAVRVPMTRAIGPGDLPATFAVARHMARRRPDVVHAHGAKGGVYGRLAAGFERRRKHPVAAFYAPHGGSLHYDKASMSGRVFFAVERALERLTDGLIHVSAYEAETYRQKIGVPRCPAHVVRNGLRPEEFAPISPSPDVADFLFIGELRALKGVDVFIEAIAKLQREGYAARAVIVGPATPEDARRYRDMANTHVKGIRIAFHPPMPARQAFSLARIVVVPSRAESLPYLVLEAAAAGMPLIATNVGGIPEIFAGEAERLVRAGSVEALASAMATAFDSPGRMVSEAVLRRARIEQKFSLAVTARQIEDIYRAALEARYTTLRASAVAEADVSR
jgi:glycosyltransferase involved in cell wall biosynthesis